MQWSNPGRQAKSILPKELAEQTVLDFVPMRFDLGTPEQAMNYLAEKKKGSDFRMNDAIRIQTGIDQVEKVSEEEKVEEAALEKLKEIQEGAYQQAYALGLEEGRRQAFEQVSADIAERMTTLDSTLLAIKELKKEMATFNEAHLMKVMFQMASRLARTQLENNGEAMVQILRDAVGLAQDEENITVHVSQNQFDFLEELKQETGREFEFIKKIRFEPNPEVTDGGCIVETNYGEVDARVEQRVQQLWTVLAENMPKVKDRIAG